MRDLREGLRLAGRSWGLAVLLLAVNLALAASLAVPLAVMLEADLHERPSAGAMRDGFDFPWWSRWSDTRTGFEQSLSPDILGSGFAFKNLDLLVKGALPGGLFVRKGKDGTRPPTLDPLILGLGAMALVLHNFVTGGVLAVLRQAQGRWTMRAFLHASGFYFGRFLRIALVMLALTALLYTAWSPVAQFMENQARQAVSERTAMAWLVARVLVLFVGLALVFLVSAHARILTVLEDRSSALLAVVSALAVTVRTLGRGAAAILLAVAAWAALVALWASFESAFPPTGYASQVLALAVMQALLFARILLRVSLLGGLMTMQRRRTPAAAPRLTD